MIHLVSLLVEAVDGACRVVDEVFMVSGRNIGYRQLFKAGEFIEPRRQVEDDTSGIVAEREETFP